MGLSSMGEELRYPKYLGKIHYSVIQVLCITLDKVLFFK